MFQEFQRYSAPVFMLKYVIDIARTGQGIPVDLVDNVRATSGFEKHFIYSITNLEAASLTSANYCDELLAMIHTHSQKLRQADCLFFTPRPLSSSPLCAGRAKTKQCPLDLSSNILVT